jgi:GAF domain-containing protein
MRALVLWLQGFPAWLRVGLSSLLQAAPFYGAALLRGHVGAVAAQSSVPALVADGLVVTLVLTAVLSVRGYFMAVQREVHKLSESRQAALSRAHHLVDRIVSHNIVDIDDDASAETTMLFGSARRLSRVVQAVYDLFEGAYGGSGESAVSFEATFMTRSYCDGFITIPAYANRDARAPVSLQQRQSNPRLYEQTVCAQIYRQQSPVPCYVEDTEKDPGYNSLYEGQKRRIRSCVVYPVRDARNRLLGTLVVHCDKPGFFSVADERYWNALLELFSKRLAYEKAKMDRLSMERRSGKTSVSLNLPDLPF